MGGLFLLLNFMQLAVNNWFSVLCSQNAAHLALFIAPLVITPTGGLKVEIWGCTARHRGMISGFRFAIYFITGNCSYNPMITNAFLLSTKSVSTCF